VWETIRKSPLIAEYNRLMTWCGWTRGQLTAGLEMTEASNKHTHTHLQITYCTEEKNETYSINITLLNEICFLGEGRIEWWADDQRRPWTTDDPIKFKRFWPIINIRVWMKRSLTILAGFMWWAE
jgi:hypothetical protein